MYRRLHPRRRLDSRRHKLRDGRSTRVQTLSQTTRLPVFLRFS